MLMTIQAVGLTLMIAAVPGATDVEAAGVVVSSNGIYETVVLNCLLIFFLACNQPVKVETISDRIGVTNKAHTIELPEIETKESSGVYENDPNLPYQNTVFKLGSSNHLSGCNFLFECDCCFGYLILLDSTFYYADQCVTDIVVTRGSFSLKNDSLVFISDGIRVEEAYNWERETDSTAQAYMVSDTIMAPYTMKFSIESCQDKIKLIEKGEEQDWVALPLNLMVEDELRILEEKGILEVFRNK